jgi:hypothetical protein
MHNAVEFVSFNLKKGATVTDFLLASDKMNREFLSVQKGYISRQLLVDGETWADLVLWETMDDARHAAKICNENASAVNYFSYIENVDFHDFSIEKGYQCGREEAL